MQTTTERLVGALDEHWAPYQASGFATSKAHGIFNHFEAAVKSRGPPDWTDTEVPEYCHTFSKRAYKASNKQSATVQESIASIAERRRVITDLATQQDASARNMWQPVHMTAKRKAMDTGEATLAKSEKKLSVRHLQEAIDVAQACEVGDADVVEHDERAPDAPDMKLFRHTQNMLKQNGDLVHLLDAVSMYLRIAHDIPDNDRVRMPVTIRVVQGGVVPAHLAHLPQNYQRAVYHRVYASPSFRGVQWYSSVAIDADEGASDAMDDNVWRGVARLLFRIQDPYTSDTVDLALIRMYEKVDYPSALTHQWPADGGPPTFRRDAMGRRTGATRLRFVPPKRGVVRVPLDQRYQVVPFSLSNQARGARRSGSYSHRCASKRFK